MFASFVQRVTGPTVTVQPVAASVLQIHRSANFKAHEATVRQVDALARPAAHRLDPRLHSMKFHPMGHRCREKQSIPTKRFLVPV